MRQSTLSARAKGLPTGEQSGSATGFCGSATSSHGSRLDVSMELGLSQASYYRSLREAVDAVVDILWRRYGEREEAADIQRAAEDSIASTAGDVTQRAIDIAVQTQGEAVRLDELLANSHELVRPLFAQRGIDLSYDISDCLPSVLGDPAILRQVMLSVLTESARLTAGRSLIASLSAGPAGLAFRLAGLDASALARWPDIGVGSFDIANRLLESYGSELVVAPGTVGPGSAASIGFTLPPQGPSTILVIDDDADTLRLYSLYLQDCGHTVRVAQTAEQAHAILSGPPVRLVLLDVLMPREDGWDILRQIRSSTGTADIPVIICSVLPQPDLALSMGASLVLPQADQRTNPHPERGAVSVSGR